MICIAQLCRRTLAKNVMILQLRTTSLTRQLNTLDTTLQNNDRIKRSRRLVARNSTKPPVRYLAQQFAGQVRHDPQLKQFYIEIKGFDRAVLDYTNDDGQVTMYHTEVPKGLEGRGLAKLLAQAALEYVVQNGFNLYITCPYIKNYVRKVEPKYLDYMRGNKF